jgi:hypothetical protein
MPSTWTKKVAAPIAAVATTAAVLVAGGGSVAAASSSGLTVHQAGHLAHKLVVKQRRERSLLFAHLGKPKRRSSTRIDFAYEDRSTDDVLCVARIVVRQTSGSRHAELVGAKCHGIPSDVLGYERVTGKLAQSLPNFYTKVQKSLDRYHKSVADCDYVAVPQNRAKDVDVLMRMGFQYALLHPLRNRLGGFAQALHDVHAADPRLASGLDSWDNVLIVFDELDPATHDPCAAVKEWAAGDWSDASAPADFDELRVERDQLKQEAHNLRGVARHLADAGARRGTAILFALDAVDEFFVSGTNAGA